MIPGDGKTTRELFAEAGALLVKLERLMSGRKQRDKACMTLTDVSVILEGLARRLQQVEFTGGPVMHDDEEEHDRRTEGVEPLVMADLLEAPADELEADEAAGQGVTVRELRLRYFRQFLDYQVAGCRSVEDVMRKTLAFARRFRPDALREFGLSMSDVGRRLGESRAKVHAREKRLVEEPLKRSGARGFHGLGGQRSEQHRERCRAAQKGNTNRLKGERRKRDEAA